MSTRARTSELSAVAALRNYQTDYPDYDAEDWMNAIEGVFRAASVRAVARELANLADWSLRGISISQERLAKSAGVSRASVSSAVSKMAAAGHLVVSKRPARKTSNGYTQYPDVYRLVIPEARTWDMSLWDEADAFQAYIPETDRDTPPWAEDSADASANRAYWDQVNRLAGGENTQANQTPHAWTWLDTRWITQPQGSLYSCQLFLTFGAATMSCIDHPGCQCIYCPFTEALNDKDRNWKGSARCIACGRFTRKSTCIPAWDDEGKPRWMCADCFGA